MEYSNRNAYANGLKGQYANEYHKGLYGVAGARNRQDHDAAKHYANQNHGSKAHRGGSFSNAKGHDKAEKTTGYHKIINKDELKKDHRFYDKADRRGFYNRYGDFDAQQNAKEGSFKSGNHHDSGYKENEFGSKEVSDKGKFAGENEGYNGARGFDKYFRNYQDFGEKGEKIYGAVSSYSEGDNFDDYLWTKV